MHAEHFRLLIIIKMNTTLADWTGKNKCSILKPARLLRQITELLSDIHSRGEVHGSLSPFSVTLDSTAQNVVSISANFINNDVRKTKELLDEWRPAEEIDSPPSQEGDIFSLGCLFVFVLSNGEQHPFGKAGQRDLFIAFNLYDLSWCEDIQLQKLITRMISHSSSYRPSCADVKNHPFIWTDEEVYAYLHKLVDSIDVNSDQYKIWTRKILFSSESLWEKNIAKRVNTVAEILTQIKVSMQHNCLILIVGTVPINIIPINIMILQEKK